MAKRRICQAAAFAVVLIHLFSLLLPALAEIHPLGGIADKDNSGIQDLDITISLDWAPDTVTGAEANPRGMTTAEFQTAINGFAQSLFAMTNGLHRLRNVYVFKNKAFWDMADVRYISTQVGRSAAHVSYWKKKGGHIVMYVYESLDAGVYTRDDYPGPVLAHECGHYIYGVYDEYQEAGGKTREQLRTENKLWSPAGDDDGSQASIMNQHVTYPNWFSLDNGYDTDTRKNSAQYRMFGKSIWSTIVSDPVTDHANARDDQRTWFDAFKGKSVLRAVDLLAHQTNPLAGWDSKVNIVWMTTDVHTVMVLDSSMPANVWSTALKGCAAGIRAMKVDNWTTIMRGSSLIADRTQLTVANKSTLITQVSSLVQGSSATVEASLRAALAQIVRQRAEMGTNMTSNIYLMTNGNPAVPFSLVKDFADAKAMLTVASYSQTASEEPASGYISVKDLSGASGGKTNIASKAQVMKSHVARDINVLEDDRITDIAASLHPGPLTAGTAHTMNFTAGPNDDALEIAIFADEDEWGNVQPTLTDPVGRVRTVASVAAGFSVETDNNSGMWIFRIDTSLYAGATGQWTAAMTATAPVNESSFMVASAVSELTMEVSVRESPLYGYVAQASVKGDRPILGARVTAAVYDSDGSVPRVTAMPSIS